MKNLICLGTSALLMASCASWREQCAYEKEFGINTPRPQVTAIRTSEKITLDGRLDEDFWKAAPTYKMQEEININPPNHSPKWVERTGPFEGGDVKFAYDDEYLYLGAKLIDTDVVQCETVDQEHYYRTGDVLEIFIKSEKAPNYWEIYGTPNGLRTTFKYTSRNYCMVDWDTLAEGYKCAATVQGTLNNYKDIDEGWTIEMAIPISIIEECTGVKFTPDGDWIVLVARYNYLYGRGTQQFGAVPHMPEVNHHLHEYYARLLLK